MLLGVSFRTGVLVYALSFSLSLSREREREVGHYNDRPRGVAANLGNSSREVWNQHLKKILDPTKIIKFLFSKP